MPSDLEGPIIERAKWNHFNVTTLAILRNHLTHSASAYRKGRVQIPHDA